MKVVYILMIICILMFCSYVVYKAGIVYGVMLLAISFLCLGITYLLSETISQRLKELDNEEVVE